MEPPWKKRKPNPPPSFLSFPNEIILNILSRIPKSYYPKLSLVSKTFRSLVLSTDLSHARFHHKTKEAFFHVCLQCPDRPHPSWFTLWINPDHIDEEKTTTKNKKKIKNKKKSALVHIPASYYCREVPLFVVNAGSDVYAFRQCYPPSTVMLVRNKKSYHWRKAPNMTVARVNPVARVLDGKIYVMGGCSEYESAYWGEVFDTKTQTWEPLPDPGPELRFYSVIRKTEMIIGKFYVRSNESKDSLYDPKESKWNVARKAQPSENMCMVDKVWYSYRSQSCFWLDREFNEWRQVKGLSLLNKTCRRGLIETVNYGGKLLVLWDKFTKPGRGQQDKNICCALIAFEKRQDGQVWGTVEWSNVVLTVPSSYVFLRSTMILT